MDHRYITNFLRYTRRSTCEVNIGGTRLGGNNPIRLQSMTNTLTSDVMKSVQQIIRIAREGADYVRLTVPGKKDADALPDIIAELSKRDCTVPLIADIHFNPRLAMLSAEVMDKVRINPGNFIDKKKFDLVEYSESEYKEELRRLREKFLELLNICREHKTALRIGTNHGSLSDRIMSRYGDTPEGMAESAMEFLRICRDENFKDVVVSMKASNTRVMVYATRLLLAMMCEEEMDFPLHLGVTEAGEGEDGRIKSAVGIGALLADGIGDTIRVSLTEDPELEIPVARKLVDQIAGFTTHDEVLPFGEYPKNPYDYSRRKTAAVENTGDENLPVIVHKLNGKISSEVLEEIGWKYSPDEGWTFEDQAPDYIWTEGWDEDLPPVPAGRVISTIAIGKNFRKVVEFEEGAELPEDFSARFLEIECRELTFPVIEKLNRQEKLVLILKSSNKNSFADMRAAVFRLMNADCQHPVIFKKTYAEDEIENLQLKSATDLGGLLIDGLGDGICLENKGKIGAERIVSTAFGILQASRVRISKTEYISCPSCGRTLFDLQQTTKKIRERTNHLKGLKIGIMGCIVNGPGEMADADYGYVGAGRGRVTLYKEKKVVRRNIEEAEAVEALIQLIKENGDWNEPVSP